MGGEIFIDKWGSLRHAGNVAAICVRAASLGVNTDKYMAFARQQVSYILGSTGRSFIVGYGVNPPTHCHHRGASCYGPNSCCDPNCPDANPNVLTGALVGGPGEANDYYNDARNDYVMNEVALDYNSGFQMAVAGLLNDAMDSTTVPPTDPPTDGPTDGTTGEGIQRIQLQRKIQTTTALEETLRLAYLSAQGRMLISTRRVSMTAWRTVEQEYLL